MTKANLSNNTLAVAHFLSTFSLDRQRGWTDHRHNASTYVHLVWKTNAISFLLIQKSVYKCVQPNRKKAATTTFFGVFFLFVRVCILTLVFSSISLWFTGDHFCEILSVLIVLSAVYVCIGCVNWSAIFSSRLLHRMVELLSLQQVRHRLCFCVSAIGNGLNTQKNVSHFCWILFFCYIWQLRRDDHQITKHIFQQWCKQVIFTESLCDLHRMISANQIHMRAHTLTLQTIMEANGTELRVHMNNF